MLFIIFLLFERLFYRIPYEYVCVFKVVREPKPGTLQRIYVTPLPGVKRQNLISEVIVTAFALFLQGDFARLHRKRGALPLNAIPISPISIMPQRAAC